MRSRVASLTEVVPLVVPEINPEDIEWNKGIIANPNCSTIIMLVPLFPLHKISPIKRIIVSTYQAASGAGQPAMDELVAQTSQVLEGEAPTKEIFPNQIAFNLFSHNSPINEIGYCEEEMKMVNETKKIFHDDSIEVVPTTIRIPIMRAHSESILVETESPISLEAAREALAGAPGVKVVDDRDANTFPMPLEAQDTDPVLVGRLRHDPFRENALALFVSGDQIRKGAALNAIQIAEVALGV